MPNHTANIVTVSGPAADVLAFIEQAKAKKPMNNEVGEDVFEALDFDSFVPMPEELRGTNSPVKIQTQEEIDAMWAEHKRSGSYTGAPLGLGITQEKHDDLMKKYGVADWYEWAIRNWGTKWGAYDVGQWKMNGPILPTVASASISFDTAWSPATPFWGTVSEKYPSLKFVNEYADEGGGFLGYTTFENGSAVETDVEWDSTEGIALRKRLGRWYEEDESEE